MTPREERDLLVGVVVRLAQQQLEQGGFVPFGATLAPGRNVQLLIPKSSAGRDTTVEIVDAYWKRQMGKALEGGAVRALCTVADVRETNQEGKVVPGVFVHFEHCEGDAEDVLYRYTKTSGAQVLLEQPVRATANLQYFRVA